VADPAPAACADAGAFDAGFAATALPVNAGEMLMGAVVDLDVGDAELPWVAAPRDGEPVGGAAVFAALGALALAFAFDPPALGGLVLGASAFGAPALCALALALAVRPTGAGVGRPASTSEN
jgi:hypothetical protein